MSPDQERLEIIIDDELRLYHLAEDNVEALFALVDRNREYLLLWFPQQYVYWDREQVWEDLSPQGVMRTHSPRTTLMGIWYRGELAGVISAHPSFPDSATYSLGYWVSEELQGRGIVTRAARALVEKLFSLEWVKTVEIRCWVENLRSQGVPRRLGFVQGELVPQAEYVREKYVDEIVFRMSRELFDNLKEQKP